MLELSIATATFLIGLALGWALSRSTGAAITIREDNARLRAELAHQKQVVPEQLALLEQAQTDLKASFDALAATALRTTTDEFLKLAEQRFGHAQKETLGDIERRRQAIDELIAPIRDTLAKVDVKIGESDRERVHTRAELTALLKGVSQQQDRLREETANLVRALRTPNVRGRWGEVQLRRVIELAGMLDHCDFDEQPSLIGEFGRQRPDVIVKLPGNRTIVVDAKVPLEAYLAAHDTQDEALRTRRLGDHARQLRDHMTKLGAKSYWEQVQPSPEFVVMFLPGESFFQSALQHDTALM
jgi:DNA recombination protein RmuC